MTGAEFGEGDGCRVECWDSVTETAQVLREVSLQHEAPVGRLVQLVRSIAHVRGSAILSVGSTDIVRRDAAGGRFVMQADATIYLHPERDLPAGKYIETGSDPLPDVVFEVDHTTNVGYRRRGRRGKLDDYAALGLPEIWVEVPDSSKSRGGRRPGLTILVLVEGAYVEAPTSRAFPGWRASEIHRALNEVTDSPQTVATLRRVGRTLGAAGGGSPDGDLFLKREHAAARAAGRAAGRVEGRAEGRTEGLEDGLVQGRREVLQAGVAAVLAGRGIPVSAALRQWLVNPDDCPDSVRVFQLASTCRDAGDLLRRLRGSDST